MQALRGLGLCEVALAAWVLSGIAPVRAAQAQTLLLVAMNAGGLLWGGAHIADPGAMIVQNAAFLALVWIVAGLGPGAGAAAGESAWRRGRFDGRAGPHKLLFGHMYEDWLVEAAAFAPASPVFCIASAGCTALALAARGHDVTAVDINPAQIAYVKDRLAGAAARDGAAERFMGLARRFTPAFGWSGARLRQFLELQDPAEQLRLWDKSLEGARFRLALRMLFEPRMLRFFFSPALLQALPDRFPEELRRRFRRAFARHSNLSNPYAWRLLLGSAAAPAPAVAAGVSIQVACADAAEYLESCAAGSFQSFSLSNILDAADAAYAGRLFAAVRRAAAPDAIVVVRSFQRAATAAEEETAARDRGIIWGRVDVREAATLPR